MSTAKQEEFKIQTLGEPKLDTTLQCHAFVDGEEILFDLEHGTGVKLEVAGPRKKIYFEPSKTKVGIVTCGGLCPGINDVIRAIVMALYHRYGVKDIVGYKYGYEGLNPELSQSVLLTPEYVKNLHTLGGTALGSSRGPQDIKVMTKFLVENKINILFTVGGDGTLKGAQEMADEIVRQGLNIAVVGVPKTIDNDLLFMQKTFGFETAVTMAQIALKSAHTEALSARGGIGIVKLMGRDSGFISLYASVASSDVNLLLIPEVKFTWQKIFEYVEWRIVNRGHCLIAIAEGAGQDLCEDSASYDKSGNKVLADIGLLVKKQLSNYFISKKIEHTIKYIDPSYTIRSSPAEPADKIFCIELAHMAVHAAMTGRTSVVPGLVHGRYVNLPIKKVVEKRKCVNPNDMFYQIFLDNSGMPVSLV
jgi:6-phosphofructokinase 1